MNDGFKIEPLAIRIDKGRPGATGISPSLFPRFTRERVSFQSMAPAWLINGIRGVLFAYVPTKRLKVIRESYVCNNRGVMQEFLIESVEHVMCHKNAPVNSKYAFSAHSDKNSIMLLQTASFNPMIDSNAIRDAFDGSILIGRLDVDSKLYFEAIVVEEPAYKSPIKPIEKKFVFYPAAAMEMYRSSDDANIVFDARNEIDKPPYFVSYVSHGYGPAYGPLREAVNIIIQRLTAWKATLSSSITVSGRAEHNIVEHTWVVDEPLDHISSLLRGILVAYPKKYRSVIMQHNHITVTTAFRLVFDGSLDDLISDLTERINETIAEVRKFNLPE